jgi:hypothetical protein
MQVECQRERCEVWIRWDPLHVNDGTVSGVTDRTLSLLESHCHK